MINGIYDSQTAIELQAPFFYFNEIFFLIKFDEFVTQNNYNH